MSVLYLAKVLYYSEGIGGSSYWGTSWDEADERMKNDFINAAKRMLHGIIRSADDAALHEMDKGMEAWWEDGVYKHHPFVSDKIRHGLKFFVDHLINNE